MLATLAIRSSSVRFIKPRPNAAGAQSRKVATMIGCRVRARRCEWMFESNGNRTREKMRTETHLSRFDELPDSVEGPESKLDKPCSDNPSSTPTSANGKVPTNCSSEGAASDVQTARERPFTREGSKSAVNDLCARAEVKAELMYQLGLELEDSAPAI